MKILLVFPSSSSSSILTSASIPVGTLAIATFLKHHGHEVRILDRAVNVKMRVAQVIKEFSPEVLCVTFMTTLQYDDSLYVSKLAKAKNIPVLWGGTSASALPEAVLKTGVIDYVGIGEGEYTILELLDVIKGQREPESVKGIYYIDKNGKTVSTPRRPFADLSDFPSLDYSLLENMENYLQTRLYGKRLAYVHYSKGCPFACTFCFNERYYHRSYRKRSHEHVLQEIQTLVNKYHADAIYFSDEIFGVDKQDLEEFCAKLKKLNLPIKWHCETRVGQLTIEDMNLMHETGCYLVSIGVESGSSIILEKVNKNYDLKKLYSTAQDLHKAGIELEGLFILGFPDETHSQVKQTIHTIFRLNPHVINITFFQAIPGSVSFEQLQSEGKISKINDLSMLKKNNAESYSFQNFSKVPTKDLNVIRSFFNYNMVFRKKKTSKSKMSLLRTAAFIFFRNMKNHKLSNIFKAFYYGASYFLKVLWYAHAYPSIRKKYDLYAKNFGRTDWDDLSPID